MSVFYFLFFSILLCSNTSSPCDVTCLIKEPLFLTLTNPVCFMQDMPYSKSQYKKCAVIGNGGIIKNSKCGKEIDSADFVFRYTG